MASKLDFAAALGEQLKAAGAQMRAMRAPKEEMASEPAEAAEVRAVAPARTSDIEERVSETVAETVPVTASEFPVRAAPAPQREKTVAPDKDECPPAPKKTEAAVPPTPIKAPEPAATVNATVTKAVAQAVRQGEPDENAVPCEPLPRPPAETARHIPPDFSSAAPDVRHSTAAPQKSAEKISDDDAPLPERHIAEEIFSPALSERAWRGGVRGAVLDMLHQLAPGQDYVLVNLKRLAAHMGISYGSVRNAMSRLVQSGEISTRQIRVADGHGVRVDFLDDAGRPQSRRTHSRREPPSRASRTPRTAMQSGGAAVPEQPAIPSFWETSDEVFDLAWPHAAAAGVSMDQLRPLRAVFTAQGFSEAGLPRSLRHLDWQLEQLNRGADLPEAPTLIREFLSRLRRQGYLPRPEGYEDPELLRLREEAEEERARAALQTEHP